MRTSIASIRRYGTLYRVSLACGHAFTVTADQLRAQQLFVGKPIACGELHVQEAL
jgi:hypothetical protein